MLLDDGINYDHEAPNGLDNDHKVPKGLDTGAGSRRKPWTKQAHKSLSDTAGAERPWTHHQHKYLALLHEQ